MRNKTFFLTCLLCVAILLASHPMATQVHSEKAFLDRLTFFGESTTTHLRNRGGIPRERVWSGDAGTAKLDASLLHRPLRFEEGLLTPTEAASRYTPEILVLSFGLNGILYFSEHPDSYIKQYRSLIDSLSAASPHTRFLIQSVYPVAEHPAEWSFSCSPKEINERIALLNRHLPELCRALPSTALIDTASSVTDEHGFLREEFTTDGIHLNESAYRAILGVISAYSMKK